MFLLVFLSSNDSNYYSLWEDEVVRLFVHGYVVGIVNTVPLISKFLGATRLDFCLYFNKTQTKITTNNTKHAVLADTAKIRLSAHPKLFTHFPERQHVVLEQSLFPLHFDPTQLLRHSPCLLNGCFRQQTFSLSQSVLLTHLIQFVHLFELQHPPLHSLSSEQKCPKQDDTAWQLRLLFAVKSRQQWVACVVVFIVQSKSVSHSAQEPVSMYAKINAKYAKKLLSIFYSNEHVQACKRLFIFKRRHKKY